MPFERHGDGVAGGDAAGARVGARQLDLAAGPLEGELGRALDGGAGEERAVGQQAQARRPSASFFAGGFGSGCTAAGRTGSAACSLTAPNGMPP